MPTKPTPAVTPQWNTGAANRSTPSGGKIALGWEANEEPSSSYFNWWMYETGLINAWVLAGSSDGAADAHIVETDANGATTLRALTVLGGAATSVGISATGTTGAGPAAGVGGTGVGAAPGVTGVGGGGNISGSGDTLNGGVGVRGISGSGTGVSGVLGIGRSGGDHPGVYGLGAGTSAGVYGESTSTTGIGVEGQGGSVSGIGVHGIGGGSGAGVRGDGGAGGPGVWGVTPDITAAYGVLGSTSSGSDSDCAGVRGTGVGDAMGVYGVSVNGYGVVSEVANNVRAALRLVPQGDDPSTAADGDIAYVEDGTVDDLRVRSRSGWRSAMLRTLGYTYGHEYFNTDVDSNDSVLWTDVLTVSLAAPNDPRRVGDVRIRVTGEVGRTTSNDGNIELRVYDDDANVTVESRTVMLVEGDGSWERDIAWEFTYTLPATGPRDFIFQIRRSGGSNAVGIRNAMMTIEGVF